MITVVVDNRIRVPLPLPEQAVAALKGSFSHANPKHHKLVAMGYRPGKDEPPVIRTWRAEGAYLTFPRGGMKRVRAALRDAGVAYSVQDARTEGDRRYAGELPDYQGHAPRPYQTAAVEQILAKENCLVRSGTGSGKSEMAMMTAGLLKLPTLVVVWSSPLFQMWVKRLRAVFRLSAGEVGEIQGATRRFGPVTVAMQQTLWSRLDDQIRRWPGFVIVDEVHRAASKTLQYVSDEFPARYRLGVSDDERRTDGKEFLIYDQFGDVALEVKYDDLADQGHILDVEVRVVPSNYRPPEEYWQTRDFNLLLDDMTSDAPRNQLVRDLVVMEAQAREQVFVMSHRVAHCHALDSAIAASGVRTGLLLGGDDWRDVYETTARGLERGELRCGVGTIQNIGTGIDLPTMGVSVVATPIAGNESMFRQARGRVCRVAHGKTDARMYYVTDLQIYGTKHVRNLTKWSRRVVVLEGGEWVPADQWLAAHKGGA